MVAFGQRLLNFENQVKQYMLIQYEHSTDFSCSSLLSAAAIVRSDQPMSAVGSDGDASCVTTARVTWMVQGLSTCAVRYWLTLNVGWPLRWVMIVEPWTPAHRFDPDLCWPCV